MSSKWSIKKNITLLHCSFSDEYNILFKLFWEIDENSNREVWKAVQRENFVNDAVRLCSYIRCENFVFSVLSDFLCGVCVLFKFFKEADNCDFSIVKLMSTPDMLKKIIPK